MWETHLHFKVSKVARQHIFVSKWVPPSSIWWSSCVTTLLKWLKVLMSFWWSHHGNDDVIINWFWYQSAFSKLPPHSAFSFLLPPSRRAEVNKEWDWMYFLPASCCVKTAGTENEKLLIKLHPQTLLKTTFLWTKCAVAALPTQVTSWAPLFLRHASAYFLPRRIITHHSFTNQEGVRF